MSSLSLWYEAVRRIANLSQMQEVGCPLFWITPQVSLRVIAFVEGDSFR